MNIKSLLIPLSTIVLMTGCQSSAEFFDNASNTVKNILPGSDIHSLAAKGDLEGVKGKVAEYGVEAVNKRNDNGITPLMMAAYKGQLKVVEYLINNGAEIKAKNKDGETAFHAAAQGKQVEVFTYLKAGNTKLAERADYNQVTPYMRAAFSGIGETFFYLLDDRAFFAKDAQGGDILSWAVGGGNVGVTRYYGNRAGDNLNIEKVRKAHLENFQNPNSKQTLPILASIYCDYALMNKSFKPKPTDNLKFGRYCNYDFRALIKKREAL
ncbi:MULTISPECIES: ankyrin repeat domain-containing protein [unclassified Pseudoalteromonas]|uniref:ankyrin repeat domain-containing protein n=1 Tax=unclassified Pseudoalteromonas TaxID=194690 RepID=UPI0030151499